MLPHTKLLYLPSKFTPWYYGWNVIGVALLAAAMTIGIVLNSFTFFVISWIDEFELSRAHGMLALSAGMIGTGLLYPFAGYCIDKFSIRWVAVAGISSLSIGLLLLSVTTAYWQIIVIYAVILSVSDTLAGQLLPKSLAARWFRARRNFALSIATLGVSFGTMIFPITVTFLIEQFGWRGAVVILAVSCFLLSVPLLLLIIGNSPEDKGIEPEPEAKLAIDGEISISTSQASEEWTMRKIISQRAFWFLVLAFLPILEVGSGFSTNFGPFTQDLGISVQSAAFLLFFWSIAQVVGKVGFGYLADLVDYKKLYFIGYFLFCLGLLLLTIGPGFYLMLFIVVLLGVASGSDLPLVGAIIAREYGPSVFARVLGLFYLCLRPLAFAAPLAGWVADFFGSYNYFFIGGLIFTLICSPAIFKVKVSSESKLHKTPAVPSVCQTAQEGVEGVE